MDEMLYSIRRQMLMDLFSDENYKPLKLKELCMMLNVPRNEKTDLKIMLDRMISEELVTMTDHGRYKKLDPNELTGTFSGTARGFGFVALSGQDKDVFIPEDQTLGALHGDTVRIQITEDAVGGRRAEGQVVKIVVRANDTLIGTYEKNKNYGFVIPDNPKISKDIFHSAGEV